MIASWPEPTLPIRLESGWAHVYMIALEKKLPDDQVAWLSAEEQARAARYRSPEHSRRFIAAHIQVRQILSSYEQVRPGELTFTTNEHGKPALVGSTRMQFNLSHTSGWALLAVTDSLPVGIDLESQRENVNHHGISNRFFSPAEVNALAALPENERLASFLSVWTRKEAYIKARGGGLSIPLTSFDVSVHIGNPVTLVDRGVPGSASGWSIYDIPLGDDFFAALAVNGSLEGIRSFRWPG
jgi:4'-phosphopantetheinyl transferase